MPKSRSTTAKFAPVHPGEILRETLDDIGLSMNQLAQAIHVPANRISAIVAGKRSITGETALRLGSEGRSRDSTANRGLTRAASTLTALRRSVVPVQCTLSGQS